MKHPGCWPRPLVSAFFAAAALAASSCGEVETSSRTPQLPRDAPELSIEPLFTLNGERAEFGRIGSIVADPEGTVYVADQMAEEIRVFDSAGRPIRTIGRRGKGPGEFGALLALGWKGDSLVALDFSPARLTLFDAQGEIGGTLPWPSEAGRPRGLLVAGTTTYGVGTISRQPDQAFTTAAEAEAAYRPPTLRYSELGSAGVLRALEAAADTLTEPRGFDCDARDGGRIESFEPLFGAAGPLRAITPAGQLVVARRDVYRIDFVNLETGDTIRTLEGDIRLRPVTDADWAEATRTYRERNREVPLDCGIERRRPEYLPVIRSVVADADGNIWIEARTPEGFSLAVLDSTGRLAGESPLPARDPRVPLYIRAGRIYLVLADALGVQSVLVLRAFREG